LASLLVLIFNYERINTNRADSHLLTQNSYKNTREMVNVMKVVEVPGKNTKHKVFLYALSTCAWCKLTKKFLKDNSVKYEYVDVDLCNEEERKKIRGEIMKRGEIPSYPAVIIDGKELIIGFYQDKIREALEI